MLAALAAVLVAAAPVKIAAPGLSYVNLDPKTGEFYLEYFAQQLAGHPGIQVMTAKETAVLLGMERQRDLLSCGATNCTAELAGMLGVDLILVGSLAKAGGGFVVNLKLVKASDASAAAVYSSRLAGEDALLDYLKASADDLAAKLLPGSAVAPPPPVVAAKSEGAPPVPWVAAGVIAVGAVAAGATFFGLGASHAASLSNGDASITSVEQLRAARRQGEAEQAIGVSLLAAGGAAAVSAGVLALLPKESWVRKLTPGVLGLAAAIAGGVLFGMAGSDASKLSSGSAELTRYAQVESLRAGGEAKQAAGVTLISAGVVGLASSVLLIVLEGHSAPPVALLPGPGAGAACLLRF